MFSINRRTVVISVTVFATDSTIFALYNHF